MCNVGILTRGERVILEPPYRDRARVPVQDYYFYHAREADITEIPAQIAAGIRLRAQLIDNHDNIIASAGDIETSAQGKVLRVRSGPLSEGLYSLRFSDFGTAPKSRSSCRVADKWTPDLPPIVMRLHLDKTYPVNKILE
jgi:hypothetical protein